LVQNDKKRVCDGKEADPAGDASNNLNKEGESLLCCQGEIGGGPSDNKRLEKGVGGGIVSVFSWVAVVG